MIRKSALSCIGASALFSCLLAGLSAFAQQTTTVHLTILHTNDTHGHLLPYSYPELVDPTTDVAKLSMKHDIGGAARRATMVLKIRAEKDHSTLLIDAGDICDGTPMSTEYHGDADIAAMNAIGYDIACPGNHEYNNPIAQLTKMMQAAKFSLISANSTYKANNKTVYAPYVIKTIDGVRIAFFGLLTHDAQTYPAARTDITIEPPIETAQRIVPELKKISDMIVAVTHIGVDEDIKLAAEVKDIDVIVGGHTHTLLPRPIFIPRPLDVTPNSVHGTIIVQDFQWAGTLGRLDLIIRKPAGSRAFVERYMGKLLPVTAASAEDPVVKKVIDGFWNPISGKYGKIIGIAEGDIAEQGTDYAEYNLVADAVRIQSGADFDMENLGGVRSTLPKGPINYGDLVAMDPFGNTIFTFHATGQQILAMLKANRPAVSGITYVCNNGDIESVLIGGQPIDSNKTYSGATNSYLARTMLEKITDKIDTGKSRLQALVDYISKVGTVKPLYDGRRKLIGVSDN